MDELRSAPDEPVPTAAVGTRFWDAGGIRVSLSGAGPAVQIPLVPSGLDTLERLPLDDRIVEFTRAAGSIRILADYLARHPDPLLRGRTGN